MTEIRPLAGSILLIATVALAFLPGCGTTPAAVQGQGEPIPLDSQDPRYRRYLGRLRELIKEKWGYPCVKDEAAGNCEYKSAKLLIRFGILKNGRAVQVEVQEPSGYGIYDVVAAFNYIVTTPPGGSR